MTTTAIIQANILKELGFDSTSTVLLDRSLRWANKAIDRIQGYITSADFLMKAEVKLTTVADQDTYAMPSDFFQLMTLRDDSNEVSIDVWTREEFERSHPNPSGESTGKTTEVSLEFDRYSGRHVMRCAPIPDAAYVWYATMRCWHPSLSSTQNPIYSQLQTVIEHGGIYYGALAMLQDPEYANYTNKVEAEFNNSIKSIERIFNSQKLHPPQIPVVLKKSDY